jgi:hypothetical protein
VGLADRDYMSEEVHRSRGELRPEGPWQSASRMSDEEYKAFLFQKVERPWLTIIVATLLGLALIWLSGDDVMRSFVDSLLGR